MRIFWLLSSIILFGTYQLQAQDGYTGQPLEATRPIELRIVSPLPSELLSENTVDVFVEVDNYRLAPGGNRLHVILDNGAPLILDNVKRPIVMRDLAEGGHCVRVIAVKPDGTVHANKEAFAMVHFFVRKRDFQNFVNPELPFITLASPTAGVVEADEQGRVWLDFKVHNATIGLGGTHAVRYEINNLVGALNGPFFWPGMKPGRYQLKVELLTAEQQVLSGPFSRVDRVFEVRPPPVRAVPGTPAAAVPQSAPPQEVLPVTFQPASPSRRLPPIPRDEAD
jgi:hypothetical protein